MSGIVFGERLAEVFLDRSFPLLIMFENSVGVGGMGMVGGGFRGGNDVCKLPISRKDEQDGILGIEVIKASRS